MEISFKMGKEIRVRVSLIVRKNVMAIGLWNYDPYGPQNSIIKIGP